MGSHYFFVSLLRKFLEHTFILVELNEFNRLVAQRAAKHQPKEEEATAAAAVAVDAAATATAAAAAAPTVA
ncbi:hypothetical protein C8J57DRAFT_1512060 [Mycena rebaudengoi]|nr:hypothetical protein C8J57DRAFT_1512060 [Mycena rebaudengoi]